MKIYLVFILFFSVAFAQEELEGASIFNRGFNFREGSVIPVDNSRTKIFKATIDSKSEIWSPPGQPNLKFKIPRELKIDGFEKTLLELPSLFVKSVDDLIAQELTSENLKLNFGNILNIKEFGRGDKESNEYKKLRKMIEETKFKIISLGLYGLKQFNLKRKDEFLTDLSSTFENVLKSLPTNPKSQKDLEKYKQVIENYGGFFMDEANFGGFLKHYIVMTEKLLDEKEKPWIKKEELLLFMKRIQMTQETNWDKFFDENKNEIFSFKGGDKNLQNVEKTKEWIKSIVKKSLLISSNLRPISDLLAITPAKKANLEHVILRYSAFGKLELPPCSQLIEGVPKIPGYNVLGNGFDPFEMQVKSNVFYHDVHGFNKTTRWKNPFHPEIQFVIPSSCKITESTSTQTNSSETFSRKNQFAEYLGNKRIGQQFPGISSQSRINFKFEKNLKKDLHKVEVENTIQWYQLDLDPLLTFDPNLAEKFMNPRLKISFDKLSSTCTSDEEKKQYRGIIENWGTDLVMSSLLGGYFKIEMFYPQDFLINNTVTEIEEIATHIFQKSCDNWNYDYKKDKEVPKFFKKDTTYELITSGFEIEKPTNNKTPWQIFSEGVRTSSDALSFKLNPISTLLMRTPAKYACMNTAIADYKKEMGNKYPGVSSTVIDHKKCFEECFGRKVESNLIDRITLKCKKNKECYERNIGARATACVLKCDNL
eukprot:gene103-4352_t